MGMEREGNEESKEEQFDAEVYKQGIKRWFSLFHNSNTEKFISYFSRLIQNEKLIVFPNDIQLGGFSTAFGAGVEPDRLLFNLSGNSQLKYNFKKHFDIWEDKPTTIVSRQIKWHFSHLPSLH